MGNETAWFQGVSLDLILKIMSNHYGNQYIAFVGSAIAPHSNATTI
jgi:hypothetical protein